jgi:hypothetical protein
MLYTDVTQGINEIQLIARYILLAPPELGSCENGFTLLQEKNGCSRLGSAYPDFTSMGVGLSFRGESSLKLSC